MANITITRKERILSLHGEIETMLNAGVAKAIELGGLLTEQKAELKQR